jgi:hypothetical protein
MCSVSVSLQTKEEKASSQMGCCCSTKPAFEAVDADRSHSTSIWKEKWSTLARVLHVLRRAPGDSAFGVIVRLYALQVGLSSLALLAVPGRHSHPTSPPCMSWPRYLMWVALMSARQRWFL